MNEILVTLLRNTGSPGDVLGFKKVGCSPNSSAQVVGAAS